MRGSWGCDVLIYNGEVMSPVLAVAYADRMMLFGYPMAYSDWSVGVSHRVDYSSIAQLPHHHLHTTYTPSSLPSIRNRCVGHYAGKPLSRRPF
jgi:hypothetical protein